VRARAIVISSLGGTISAGTRTFTYARAVGRMDGGVGAVFPKLVGDTRRSENEIIRSVPRRFSAAWPTAAVIGRPLRRYSRLIIVDYETTERYQ